MNLPVTIRRLFDLSVGRLFHRLKAFDAPNEEEVARWARDLGMTTHDLKTVTSRWPQNTDLLQTRLERSGLGHVAADWRNAPLLHDLQRVCSLCSVRGRCERDVRKGKSGSWRNYCPNASTIDALERRQDQ